MPRSPGAGLLFVLTCAMGVGPVIMYGLSAVSSVVIADLRISTVQFGLLATACFLAATLASVGLGTLSDRAPAQILILVIFGGAACGLVIAWSSANLYWLLVVAVALSGGAQAMSNPATNRLIGEYVSPQKRSLWVGIKQSGVQGSQVLAGLAFPVVAIAIGWRAAAGVAAVVVLILLVISWNLVPRRADRDARTPPRRLSRQQAKTKRAGVDLAAYSTRSIRLYVGYAFFAGAALQSTNVYLPLFSQRELDFSLVSAGLTVAIAGGIGVASRIFWGRSIAGKGNSFTPLLTLGLVSALGSTLLAAAGVLQSGPLLWCGVFLHGTMGLAVVVVLMASIMRDSSLDKVGASSGIVALGMYLGFAVGPLVMGSLLETSRGFLDGWLFVTAMYLVCVVLVFISKRGVGVN